MLTVDEAVALLRAGEAIGFPTETVYGLGCDALNVDAVRKVFTLKGRPATSPLALHIAAADMAPMFVADWSEQAALLADRFWPGPLAIILPKADVVPSVTVGGGDSVSLRCPEHALCLDLLLAFGGAVAATSANLSAYVSATSASDVRSEFPDLPILDGGRCERGIESTVVNLCTVPARVVREGAITIDAIADVLACEVSAEEPEAPLTLGLPVRVVSAGELPGPNDPPAAVLAIEGDAGPPHQVIHMPRDAQGYGRRLYAELREADDFFFTEIVIERPPETTGLWRTIQHQLRRLAQGAGH
ncbi:MAG: threonylcarbamoyl-AMP synthase [Phycisphaerales bacterium]|nr:threonylcarbamoyl-AMP synthase [Phycisphaerales bacterium]